jgi:hypothetical protein
VEVVNVLTEVIEDAFFEYLECDENVDRLPKAFTVILPHDVMRGGHASLEVAGYVISIESEFERPDLEPMWIH